MSGDEVRQAGINPKPPGLGLSDDVHLYAKALELSQLVEPRRPAVHERMLNFLYWLIVVGVLGWFSAMVLDRDAPIRFSRREVVNPGKQVAQGDRLELISTRTRHRQCELTRRQTLIDGAGRRFDYEPERFDAYGAITDKPETDTIALTIPLDAATGRGRLFTAFAWDCNVLQRALGWSITSVLGPVEFEIVPRRNK